MQRWLKMSALAMGLVGLDGCATSEVYSYRNPSFAQTHLVSHPNRR